MLVYNIKIFSSTFISSTFPFHEFVFFFQSLLQDLSFTENSLGLVLLNLTSSMFFLKEKKLLMNLIQNCR